MHLKHFNVKYWLELHRPAVMQAKCFIIWLFALIICFNSACRKPSFPAMPTDRTSEQKSVDVLDENGTKLGRLEENETGDQLLLILPDGKKTPFGGYQDEIKQTAPSPDKSSMAEVSVRNTGATTDYATRLDLETNSTSAGKSEKNTVFIVKGSQPVTIQWKDDHTLLVKYPQAITTDRIYKQKTNSGDINIEYQPGPIDAVSSRYVAFSNFNYGLTGINVKGLSEEMLLRKAGWDQEKSGLTKEEWGHWYGSPPYGDDPEEQKHIQQGFIKARQLKNDNNNSK